MTTLAEGGLVFDFPNGWQALKYDESPAYRRWLGKLDGSKAVDFLALEPEGSLYLIEVKDFRGHAIENRARLRDPAGGAQSADLFHEIGEKVRDSVAGIVGAFRMAGGEWPELLRPFVEHLACDRPIKVLAWIEQDDDSHQGKPRALSDTKRLEPKVRWLTKHALVANAVHNPLADLGVARRHLPGLR